MFRSLAFLFLAGVASSNLAQPVAQSALPMHPTLTFSTFLGGKSSQYDSEMAMGVAVDASGNTYVAGTTASTNFPFTYRFGPTNTAWKAYLTKLNPDGSRLVYSSLLAGATVWALAVDPQGYAYVAGSAYGDALPVTNAFQSTGAGNFDAFVAKVTPDGSQLVYCTFLGGGDLDFATSIAADAQGNAVLTGWTTSTNFPTTAGALQTKIAGSYDAFVAKFSPQGQLVFSTYLGGKGADWGNGVALHTNGSIYVTGLTASTNFQVGAGPLWLGRPTAARAGENAYVAKLSPDGSALEYLSLIGGSGEDFGAAVAVDSAGNAYVLGQTISDDLPVTTNCLQPTRRGDPGDWDDFVAKLDPAGSRLLYATYLGGSYSEDLTDPLYVAGFYVDGNRVDGTDVYVPHAGLVVDAQGNAYVGARTRSRDLAPTGLPTSNSGDFTGYVAGLNTNASALLSFTYLGGSSEAFITGLALNGNAITVAGGTVFAPESPDFPIVPGAVQPRFGGGVGDAFVSRLVASVVAPTNDAFSQRVAVSDRLITLQADNVAATKEPGEPDHAGDAGDHSLWWSWQAPANGRLIATTAGSSFDTVLAAYSGADLATLQVLASNHVFSPDRPYSRVVFPVTGGNRYQIAVDGYQGAVGEVTLSLLFSRPGNDDFAGRIALTGFPVSTNGSNVDATREPGEPYPDLVPGRSSVWWSWVAPFSGNIAVDTAESDFNTTLAVYTNSPDAAFVVAENDNYQGLFTSQVSLQAVKGTTYFIEVDGANGDSGQIQLHLKPGAPPDNDNFADAIPLTGSSTNVTGSNVNATQEAGQPLLSFTNQGGTYVDRGVENVWWKWTAPTDGYALVSTAGSDFDTSLGVFTGTALTNLSVVAANDDWQGYTSQVYFPAISNTVYYLEVATAKYGFPGTIQLSVQLHQPPTIDLTKLAWQPDGSLRFAVRNFPGQHQTPLIQISSNLIDWAAAPGAVAADGSFTDTNTFPLKARFYRAVIPP